LIIRTTWTSSFRRRTNSKLRRRFCVSRRSSCRTAGRSSAARIGFFKEITKTNEQTGHIEDIETHYAEAKIREKELKEQVRDEDKALMVQHAEVQLMRDRIRKIRQYVGEK